MEGLNGGVPFSIDLIFFAKRTIRTPWRFGVKKIAFQRKKGTMAELTMFGSIMLYSCCLINPTTWMVKGLDINRFVKDK